MIHLTKEATNALNNLAPILDRYRDTKNFSVNYPQKLEIELIGSELGRGSLNKSCGKCIANFLSAIVSYRDELNTFKAEDAKSVEIKKKPAQQKEKTLKEISEAFKAAQQKAKYNIDELKAMSYQDLTKIAASENYDFKDRGRKAINIMAYLCTL